MKPDAPTIGVAVITHEARRHLTACLEPLLKSPLRPRIVVVNSSSNDGTMELAQEMGVEVLKIPRREFNHGSTREKARLYLQTDIVVFLTPDAYFIDEYALGKLITPLFAREISASYARQIPHAGAGIFEAFPREYNYPNKSQIRGIADASQYGIYTFFCSNSCAAYLNAVLDEIGGFQPVLLGEDTVAVAKMLRKGHKIAYVSESIVKHSHHYSLKDEFRRNFDIGLARKDYHELLKCSRGDLHRGLGYVKLLLQRLAKTAPFKIPYAIAHVFVKWAGYSLGKKSQKAPIWLKRFFSSQDFYWHEN